MDVGNFFGGRGYCEQRLFSLYVTITSTVQAYSFLVEEEEEEGVEAEPADEIIMWQVLYDRVVDPGISCGSGSSSLKS